MAEWILWGRPKCENRATEFGSKNDAVHIKAMLTNVLGSKKTEKTNQPKNEICNLYVNRM